MKKVFAAGIALAVLVGSQSAMAAPSSTPVQIASADYAYSKEATEALNYLNDIRAKMGVKAVQLDPFLMKAAQNHANYLASYKGSGHDETKGNSGFTGEEPIDRVKAIGGKHRTEALSEIISYNTSDLKGSIDTFLATAYHRQALVFQDATYLGIGIVGNKVVMELASDTGYYSNSVVYPYDGQKDAPALFAGFENPNPLEQFGIKTSGTPIYYSPEYFVDELEAVIKNSKGENVPFFKEKFLTGWFFYTKKPMTPGETYTVTTNSTPTFGEGVGIKLTKTWSFTTAGGSDTTKPEPTKPPVQATKYSSNNIGIKINGKYVDVNPKAMIVGESTFIPLRGVFESIGGRVTWENKTQSVLIEKDNVKVKLTIGSKVAFVNGKAITLATAPFISDAGSTYVPLRFASETIGAKVGWDGANWTAVINTAQ
jgi:uncharacterized protein YkwD